MLLNLWRMIRNVALAAGVLLSFFVLVEVLRAYQVLYQANPVLGYGFLVVLVVGVGWLVGYYVVSLCRHPSVLVPPPRQELAQAEKRALGVYARYLVRLTQRLRECSCLSEEELSRLGYGLGRLRRILGEKPARDALRAALEEHENAIVQPVMDRLDEEARKEVRRCVRDVILAVTLSPWRSVDLLVVLYRNARMVVGITRVYNSRPRFREQLLILRDVLGVVATVNFLNYGSRLLQNLAPSLPAMGRLADDIAQGMGAGLLTSVAGHAAVQRCRSFRGWSEQDAQATVVGNLKGFARDVKGIVIDDAIGRLKPDVVDKVRDAVSKAIDETGEVMDSFVRRPVAAAGRTVVNTGGLLRDAVVTGGAASLHWLGKGARTVGHVSVAGGHAVVHGAAVGARAVGHGSAKVVRSAVRAPGKLVGLVRRRRGDSPAPTQDGEPESR